MAPKDWIKTLAGIALGSTAGVLGFAGLAHLACWAFGTAPSSNTADMLAAFGVVFGMVGGGVGGIAALEV
jgi:hypothetical protein